MVAIFKRGFFAIFHLSKLITLLEAIVLVVPKEGITQLRHITPILKDHVLIKGKENIFSVSIERTLDGFVKIAY
jgi:hypothetical protein